MTIPTDSARIREEVERRKAGLARQLELDLEAVLLTEAGQRVWIWLMYDLCGLTKADWDDVEARRTWRLGRRSVAVHLREKLERAGRNLTLQLEARRSAQIEEELEIVDLLNRLEALENRQRNGLQENR